VKVEEEAVAGAEGAATSLLLSFGSFSVQQVLEQGTPMLASGGEVRHACRQQGCCRTAGAGRRRAAEAGAGGGGDVGRAARCLRLRLLPPDLLPVPPAPPPPPAQEYELPAEAASLSRAEQLRRQRGSLRQRLGLGGPLAGGLLDTEELLGDEDLLAQPQAGRGGGRAGGGQGMQRSASEGPASSAGAPQQAASQLLASLSGLSARERAAALRRAKSLKRTASSQPASAGPSPPKRAKGEAGGVEAAAGASGGDEARELDALGGEAAQAEWGQALEAGGWPFQPLCDQLCLQLLHPRWEARHGAALALREVLRSQAAAAGVHAPLAPCADGWSAPGGGGKRALGAVGAGDAAAAAAANASWLEDCAIHLLCVLALDRFGDFVSDQVCVWGGGGLRGGKGCSGSTAGALPGPGLPTRPASAAQAVAGGWPAGGGPGAGDGGAGAGRRRPPAAPRAPAAAAVRAAPAQRAPRRVGGAARRPAGPQVRGGSEGRGRDAAAAGRTAARGGGGAAGEAAAAVVVLCGGGVQQLCLGPSVLSMVFKGRRCSQGSSGLLGS
jgi:hypothetical protein